MVNLVFVTGWILQDMIERGTQPGYDLSQIVTKKYDILFSLFPNEELFLNQLANKLKMDDGNLSKEIKRLEEFGLVSSNYVPRERGRPRRFIRLTELGKKIIGDFLEGVLSTQTIQFADSEDLHFYMAMMDSGEGMEKQNLASEEFEIICRDYIVKHDEKLLSFIEEKIQDPNYEHILINLLNALLNMIHNTKDEKLLKEIKRVLKVPLNKIVLSYSQKPSDEKTGLFYNSFNVLVAISEGEKGYSELFQILQKLIKDGSPNAHLTRQLIFTKYDEKKNEMKRALFQMLDDPDEEVRQRAGDHIRELRTVVRYIQNRPYDV